MDDNTKLNERLSVADLRMYEGKKHGKDLSTSLSKIIIEKSNGQIIIDSDNNGTKFNIYA